jgi:hypothetical protein
MTRKGMASTALDTLAEFEEPGVMRIKKVYEEKKYQYLNNY